MKKYLIVFLSVLLSATVVFAQEAADSSAKKKNENWKLGGAASLNFSQVAFRNWAGGGEPSISGNMFFNAFANYAKDKTTWDNTLDLGYGMMRQGTKKTSVLFYKTDDKIDFASKYGRYAFKYWYYSALVGFKTQFADGYKSITDSTRVSSWMAPGYLNIALGMDFKPTFENHPNMTFSLLIAPLSGRMTFVLDSALSAEGAYGVDPGKRFRPEFGGYVKAEFKIDFLKVFTYTTKLDLFSNYIVKPQNVDMNWDNLLTIKLSKWFSANLNITLAYDDDVDVPIDTDGDGTLDGMGKRLQFKELLGFGFTYKF
ncbi:MAG: DUF3078 domain-containing protein [Bacteroidales bacterium]|nr:DUF3078 domain-containing protein [Bacteroidales bacterium]MBQ1732660.1 DUF3078 domain-containing protein [Bacteroidales bacterium]MBQ4475476.1 DUF3078 domain-containing protein [Bacteroidales bacterium]MBR6067809.1 DUF3078 domain-containing protein [Bacteroidales bacterium]